MPHPVPDTPLPPEALLFCRAFLPPQNSRPAVSETMRDLFRSHRSGNQTAAERILPELFGARQHRSKALRHRNVVQRKTCFRQLNQFRCTVDFSGVQCICQIRPGAEIVNSIRYCFLLSRVQMKNRRTPAFLPGCSPVLPFHRIKSLSVFMPLSALFPHCCTPSRKTAPAN